MDLPRPFKISLYVSGLFFAIYVVLQIYVGLYGVTYSDRENYRAKDSTYDVWEYEFLSAQNLYGKRFRVAVINDRRYTEPDVGLTGTDGLDSRTSADVPVGQEKLLELQRLVFRSLHGDHAIEAAPIALGSQVRFKAKHLRSCVVRMNEQEETKIIGKDYGMWRVPQIKKVTVRTFSPPPCAEPADSEFELPAETAQAAEVTTSERLAFKQEIQTSKVEDEKNQQRRRLAVERQARSKSIEQRLRQSARELDPALTTGRLPKNASSVLKELCTKQAALMHVLKVREVTAERQERSREEHEGYTSISYKTLVQLKLADGTVIESNVVEAQDLALVLKSVKVDERACLSLLASPSGQSDAQSMEKAAKVFSQVIDRYLREVAGEQAVSETPQEI